jgi:hypothetical protein
MFGSISALRLTGEREPMTTRHELDTKTLSTGIVPRSDGKFLALTLTQSKTLKTRKGAEKWLEARGYNPDGTRR